MKRNVCCFLFPFFVCLMLCAAGAAMAEEPAEAIDYAGQLHLNMGSETLKCEVTVKTYVDGDTTHFNVPADVLEEGVLKARYLGVNTPESTGKIEEYGKKASAYTREKLSSATSIIIESDNGSWNHDSTGERYLVWVWYRTEEMEDYRNLNIELLQEGLAIANSSAQNRYGDTCMAAIAQAKALKKNIYSGEKDPDFYYGDAIELTLREIRMNPDSYVGKKVAFSGIITRNDNNGVYVEAFDAETERYYGLFVYYGFGLSGAGLDILSVGNEARIVGTMQYYEAGGTYQVSGLTYRMMKPDDPGNIQKLSEGHTPAYAPMDAETFAQGAVTLPTEDGQQRTYAAAELAMNTSVEMRGLTVKAAYHTESDTASDGALTLTCESEGHTVQVRTLPLLGESGKLLTEDDFLGKTLHVRGIVDAFDGGYQIRVFSIRDLEIEE